MLFIRHNWYIFLFFLFFFLFFFCFSLKGNCFTFFKKHNPLIITQNWERDVSLKINFFKNKNKNKFNLKNEKYKDNLIVECEDNKNDENNKLNRNKNIIKKINKKKYNTISNDKITRDKPHIYKSIYLNKKQKYNKKDVKKIKKILKNGKNKKEKIKQSWGKKKEKKKEKKRKEQNGAKKIKKQSWEKKKEQKILDMFDKDLNQSIQKLNIKTRKFEMHKNKQNAKPDIVENEILRKIAAPTKAENREAKKREAKNREAKNKEAKKSGELKTEQPSPNCGQVKTEQPSPNCGQVKTEQPSPNCGETKNDVSNEFDIGKILKIGNSIDGFQKEIEIKSDASNQFESQVRRLKLFKTIVDFSEPLKRDEKNGENCEKGEKSDEKGEKNDEKNDENCEKNKTCTFKNIGIYDNFINVYLKYNNINTPTFYQKKIIPLIIYFLNSGYYDLIRYTNGIDSKIDSEIDSEIGNEKKTKQIIYVNKYNKTNKHLIRTFFLHCPTGTGKTFMYLLPIFQQITNLQFFENNKTKEIYNNKETKDELFYKTKQINDITSFCCSNQVNTDLFINKNSENIKNNVLNYARGGQHGRQNGQQCRQNGQIGDILILTYNKEVAVQIYELYKDIINSFYKSYSSNFFEINNSLTRFKYISEEEQKYLEKINIFYKNKINMNVHLLIGGNNIKYQLKNLRAKKINITKENEQSSPLSSLANSPKTESERSESESGDCESIINVNIYVGTPGRVCTIMNEKKAINLENIRTIIFDEYDFFFNKFEKNQVEKNKFELENVFFSQILKNIYIKKKKKKKKNLQLQT
ncbi:hypothetical protein [Plasmodium yoelii yoelii]|uniref:ATP-dependent RNA helicase n=1 Tax=Plasmodium yoelii yoelii TaxID=73239 RepID=Q7RF75_PLAYO|nr:hypothetical protein [Plasmodium yoelii yoelii]